MKAVFSFGGSKGKWRPLSLPLFAANLADFSRTPVKMADGIKVQLLKVRSFLDKFKPLQVVEEKTKVPKEYLVVGAGALAFLILLFSNGAGLLW